MSPTALVTGASRGIGRGIALALAGAGFDLVVNYAANREAAERTRDDCLAAAREAGRSIRVELCRADVGNADDRRRLVQSARDSCERLDLLVNNAGIAPKVRADILEATEESFDLMIGVNLKGPYFLTQAVARWMIEQVGQGGYRSPPKIVTVTSISAYTASSRRGDYCVAKAGLAMLTQLYAARLAEHGILVYEIRPGVIATDMTKPNREHYDRLIDEGLTPIRRWGEPSDVGRAVVAVAMDHFPFSTGEIINVDGGFHMRRL